MPEAHSSGKSNVVTDILIKDTLWLMQYFRKRKITTKQKYWLFRYHSPLFYAFFGSSCFILKNSMPVKQNETEKVWRVYSKHIHLRKIQHTNTN